ncbi:cache domain-containing protein [Sulfurospirillum sp. 1612]|uniref:cache domain-containing protein n=1 Tax=Sulfurospirillum sp. 1612 TaxID=3094835 RepID=UPI002F9567C5
MEKKFSLFNYFHIASYMVLLALVTVLITFVFYDANTKFKQESIKIEQEQLKSKKKKLKESVQNFVNYIYLRQKEVYAQTKESAKARTLRAYDIAMNLYQTYKNQRSDAEIQEMIIAVLQSFKYKNKQEYYFIVQRNGTGLLFPIEPSLKGKNVLETTNQHAKEVSQKILNTMRNKKEGFLEYKWKQSYHDKHQYDKISYMKVFEPYDWIIGTGVYVKDIEAKIKDEIVNDDNRLRYSKNYIFIGKWDGTSLTYPTKNKNMYDVVDKSGYYVVRELIKKAKEGGGFISYTMPKLQHERSIKKLSYVQGIPQWHWYVGSGVYLDDMNHEIEVLRKAIVQRSNEQLVYMLVFVLGVAGIFAWFYTFITKKIKKDFLVFSDFFDTLSHRNFFINTHALKFSEFRELAHHANKMLESKLKVMEDLEAYKKIVSNSDDFLALIDQNYIYRAISGGYETLFQKSKEEILGKSIASLLGEEFFYKNIKKYSDRALSGVSFEREYWYVTNEQRYYFHAKYFPYFNHPDDTLPAAYVVSARDITEKKKYHDQLIASEKELVFLAHNDALTSLPNRLLLLDRIQQAVAHHHRYGNKFAVCYIDLDNFKKINDSYGHSYGDEVLKQFSQKVLKIIRESDTLSRIGGDEFILLLETIKDPVEVLSVMLKIQNIFLEPFIIKDFTFFLSCSIGISVYPDHGSNSETLIKNADIAMYKAKNSGKNTHAFFKDEMSIATVAKVNIENDLREAINKQQFQVYYHPQVDLKTQKLVGLEALLRWNHPEKGLLLPRHFIDICEETRLIISIGEWVMRQSCEDLLSLQHEGLLSKDVRISINVSGVQIEYSDFLPVVQDVIETTAIDPQILEIEITESFIMQDPKRWINLLEVLREMHVKIVIDDFGTGYSSLSYLLRLPIDKLKVDMSFVSNIPEDEDACAIVRTILDLASNMKISSLAEGIETKEQEQYLAKHGCEQGQGYLYAKPMSLEMLKTWIKNRNTTHH